MFKKVLCLLMAIPILSFAAPVNPDHVSETGRSLLNHFWADMQAGNVSHIDRYMDKDFQSVHYFGALDKSGELNVIMNLHMTYYSLYNIVETRCGSVLILTYAADVRSVIDGQTVVGSAERMTVWKHIGDHWKLLTHANLVYPLLQ